MNSLPQKWMFTQSDLVLKFIHDVIIDYGILLHLEIKNKLADQIFCELHFIIACVCWTKTCSCSGSALMKTKAMLKSRRRETASAYAANNMRFVEDDILCVRDNCLVRQIHHRRVLRSEKKREKIFRQKLFDSFMNWRTRKRQYHVQTMVIIAANIRWKWYSTNTLTSTCYIYYLY